MHAASTYPAARIAENGNQVHVCRSASSFTFSKCEASNAKRSSVRESVRPPDSVSLFATIRHPERTYCLPALSGSESATCSMLTESRSLQLSDRMKRFISVHTTCKVSSICTDPDEYVRKHCVLQETKSNNKHAYAQHTLHPIPTLFSEFITVIHTE